VLAGRFEGLEALLIRADWVWERMLRDPAFETRWALYHDIGMEFPSLASIRRPRPFSGSRPLYMYYVYPTRMRAWPWHGAEPWPHVDSYRLIVQLSLPVLTCMPLLVLEETDLDPASAPSCAVPGALRWLTSTSLAFL
jgi:hypothetical protein